MTALHHNKQRVYKKGHMLKIVRQIKTKQGTKRVQIDFQEGFLVNTIKQKGV